jgi:hypothetical protein
VPQGLYWDWDFPNWQVIELCRAGYTLRLLSHVFNVHLGVRRGLSNTEMLIKQNGGKQAWRLTKSFRKYLEEKYGKDRGNCPNFWDRLNLTRNFTIFN